MLEPRQQATPNYEAIKSKQQVVWATGHYSRVGSMLQISGERLVEAMDPRAGTSFLDVAAGNGNLTLAAARRYCRVTSTDYVESSLDDGRVRAEANGFDIDYKIADAEDLPFADDSFSNVGSTYGVMFTPNQERAAAELLRVCRPGGKIGMANWTPEGFVGAMFRTIGKFNPPPAGLNPPGRWGTEVFLESAFGDQAARIDVRRRNFAFRFLSARHMFEVFSNFYGPIIKALQAQTPERRAEMEQALIDLFEEWNHATDGTLSIEGEYLEVVVTKH